MGLQEEINKLNKLLLIKYSSKIVHASLTKDSRKLVSLEVIYKKRVFRSTIKYNDSKKYCIDKLRESVLISIERFEADPARSDRLTFMNRDTNKLFYSPMPEDIEVLEHKPYGNAYKESLLPTHLVQYKHYLEAHRIGVIL